MQISFDSLLGAGIPPGRPNGCYCTRRNLALIRQIAGLRIGIAARDTFKRMLTGDWEGERVRTVEAVDWNAVWPAIATTLAGDKLAPRFLTEDGIRTAALRELDLHLDVLQCAETECPAVSLGGEPLVRLDLVIRRGAAVTVIEFKYPREPRQTLPPWPDHLGGVLSDTYRLGILAATSGAERCMQVLVAGEPFLRYLGNTMTRLGLADYESSSRLPRTMTLTPGRTLELASTTRRQLKERDRSWEVTATRIAATEISGKGLWLGAYDVTAAPVASLKPSAGSRITPGTAATRES